MELVINIPEEAYKLLKSEGVDWLGAEHILNAVAEGIPLPKGHGELVDRDKFEYLKAIHDAIYRHISWSDAIKKIKYSAPTIIEADRKEQK